MIHPTLGGLLRGLYGHDAIDRLEASPELGGDRDARAFGDALDALADLPGTAELVIVPDRDEQARFDAECARDLIADE